jgi:hypothetical protein
MVFFGEIHVFLQLTKIFLFGTRKPIPSLKNLSCRRYSFQKLTEFSQGNNVLYGEANTIDGFLCSYWNKYSLSPPSKTSNAERISFEN